MHEPMNGEGGVQEPRNGVLRHATCQSRRLLALLILLCSPIPPLPPSTQFATAFPAPNLLHNEPWTLGGSHGAPKQHPFRWDNIPLAWEGIIAVPMLSQNAVPGGITKTLQTCMPPESSCLHPNGMGPMHAHTRSFSQNLICMRG